MWTNDWFLPQYELEYNPNEEQYEGVVPLKQGYYSYQYLLMDENGTLRPVPSEGSFYQTRNTYEGFVYYRDIGGRTDRLVGYGKIN